MEKLNTLTPKYEKVNFFVGHALLYEQLYTGSIVIDEENVMKFLEATDYLQSQDVKNQTYHHAEALQTRAVPLVSFLIVRFSNHKKKQHAHKSIANVILKIRYQHPYV